MYSRCWLILRDDSKKTFEVCGQATDFNLFTNNTHGMQKAGMSVSCLTPVVSNKNSNKETIKVIGYVREEGLQKRLMEEYARITRGSINEWELDTDD